jgi:hypothetical protein
MRQQEPLYNSSVRVVPDTMQADVGMCGSCVHADSAVRLGAVFYGCIVLWQGCCITQGIGDKKGGKMRLLLHSYYTYRSNQLSNIVTFNCRKVYTGVLIQKKSGIKEEVNPWYES